MLSSVVHRVLGGGHRATAQFTLPPVVFEIAPGFVAGAALEGSKRKGRKVRKLSLQALSPRSIDPHLSRANITDTEEFGRATSSLIPAVGNDGGSFGLVVPDGAMRVALLSFEDLPRDSDAAESLIRWRMRDKLPFSAEEARATYQVLSHAPGRIEILALAMRSSVIAEYEAAFTSLNGGAALIVPATVALLPLLPETGSDAQVLVHVCGQWLTIVVMADNIPCAWRTRELDPSDLPNYEREIAAEAARVLASTREQVQSDLGRVWFCARPAAEGKLVAMISETLGRDVTPLRTPPEFVSLLTPADRSKFEQFGTTFAGLMANAS